MSPWAKAFLVLSLLMLSLVLGIGTAHGSAGIAQEEPERSVIIVELQAVNIDGRPLKGALVEAYNKSAVGEKFLNSSATNSTGWAKLYVENRSICVFKVFWKNALVGMLDNVSITANTTIAEPVVCSVCDIVINVVSAGTGAPLANIKVEISGNYTDRHGNQTAFPPYELTTNITGLCSLEDVLMNCTYKLTATRHNVLFNTTVIGPLNGTTVLNITCPRYLVRACVVDEEFRPVRGAVVEAYDWGTGELLAHEQVDEQGLAEFWALPGRCVLKALLRGDVLSETVAFVDKNGTWWPMVCRLRNLSLTVMIIDAWGNPLPGLEIRLLINDTVIATATTREDGTAVFTSLKGGLVEVIVLRGDEVLAIRWVDLRARRSLVIAIEDKVMALGHLVELLDLLAYSSMGSVLLALTIVMAVWARLSRKRHLE